MILNILLLLIQPAYGALSVYSNSNRVMMYSDNCKEVEDEIPAFIEYAKNRNIPVTSSPHIQCDLSLPRYEADITDLLSHYIKESLGKFMACDGPNCFNAALRDVGLKEDHLHLDAPEWLDLLQTYCEPRTDLSNGPQPGDIGAIRANKEGKIKEIHGFVHFKKLSFNKGDLSKKYPYSIEPTQDIFRDYQVDAKPECMYAVGTPAGCKVFTNYYYCNKNLDDLQEFRKRSGIQSLEKTLSKYLVQLPTWAEISKIEALGAQVFEPSNWAAAATGNSNLERLRLPWQRSFDLQLEYLRFDFLYQSLDSSFSINQELREAIQNAYDSDGYTLSHRAVREKDIKKLEILVKSGTYSNIYDLEGYSPFHRAILTNQEDAVTLLANKKTIERLMFSYENAVQMAARLNYPKIVRILLEKAEPYILVSNFADKSAFEWTLECNQIELAKAMAMKISSIGDYINISYNNEPLLVSLAKQEKWDLIKLFAEYLFPKQITATNDKSQTPMHIAVEKGNLEIVEYLSRKSEKLLSARDRDLKTPLQIASNGKNEPIIGFLIKKLPTQNLEEELKQVKEPETLEQIKQELDDRKQS